jgi:hypothetical protein
MSAAGGGEPVVKKTARRVKKAPAGETGQGAQPQMMSVCASTSAQREQIIERGSLQ